MNFELTDRKRGVICHIHSLKSMASSKHADSDRLISLGADCTVLPEKLLLAHAQGKVLFVTGAGTSFGANLPDFRGLALKTYEVLDAATHAVLKTIPHDASNRHAPNMSGLTPQQSAEVRRFIAGDYDVVLGMLERRMDGNSSQGSSVRQAVARLLRDSSTGPTNLHRSLMRLADRGGTTTIVTTNFDLLLESSIRPRVQSYALGAIPRPSLRSDFAGIFHIHGALDPGPGRLSDFIISDQDFGEFYLRRRVIPDFIYDAARLFHLVLVGYSANDAPMRYLLNAVAADGSRFEDVKERFTFVGGAHPPDALAMEDWKARGITPIPYSDADDHFALNRTLERWAQFSAHNGNRNRIDAHIKRIVRAERATATEADRDLFDHLVRRGTQNERVRLAELSSRSGADHGWLDAISAIGREHS